MNGFDLLVEKKLSSTQLQSALAILFNLEACNISITNDYPEKPFNDDIKIWCRINIYTGGQFPLGVSLEIFSTELEGDRKLITKKLCNILNTRCLISDDSPDPFTWIMISPNGLEENIELDPDELDNDRYVIYKK